MYAEKYKFIYMSVPTLVDMGEKRKIEAFIGKVSRYSKTRKHIEVPKNVADNFESGNHVSVKKIKR